MRKIGSLPTTEDEMGMLSENRLTTVHLARSLRYRGESSKRVSVQTAKPRKLWNDKKMSFNII